MVGQTGVVELLGAGIHALTHADAIELKELAEAARAANAPMTPEERRLAREQLRTLGHLITLTRRNLRLLRGSGWGDYGPSRG
jgi:hypothetical protein